MEADDPENITSPTLPSNPTHSSASTLIVMLNMGYSWWLLWADVDDDLYMQG